MECEAGYHSMWTCQCVPLGMLIVSASSCMPIAAGSKVRMGVHWLNADRLWYLPRSQRVCKCCRLLVREDELHLLECPGYEDLRRRYEIDTITDSRGPGKVLRHARVLHTSTFTQPFKSSELIRPCRRPSVPLCTCHLSLIT